MDIAGITLGHHEASLLADVLKHAGQETLATHVASANANRSELLLTWEEHAAVLLALERQCPPELVRLVEALWRKVTCRRSA